MCFHILPDGITTCMVVMWLCDPLALPLLWQLWILNFCLSVTSWWNAMPVLCGKTELRFTVSLTCLFKLLACLQKTYSPFTQLPVQSPPLSSSTVPGILWPASNSSPILPEYLSVANNFLQNMTELSGQTLDSGDSAAIPIWLYLNKVCLWANTSMCNIYSWSSYRPNVHRNCDK